MLRGLTSVNANTCGVKNLVKKKSAGVLWQLCWPPVSSKMKDAGVLCEQSAGVHDKVSSDES